MRDLTEKNEPTPQPLPPPPLAVTVKTITDASDLNGSASTSLAISKQEPSFGGIKSFLDRAADEGLMILQSPRVRTKIEMLQNFFKQMYLSRKWCRWGFSGDLEL